MFTRLSHSWQILALIILAVFTGLTAGNAYLIQRFPLGSGFSKPWSGTQAFIKGESPYNPAPNSQTLPAAGEELTRPASEGKFFLFPLYAVIIFAPFSLVTDYTLACALWLSLLELALGLIIIMTARLIEWNPSHWLYGVYVLFGLLWYSSVQPLSDGSALILSVFFIIASLTALRNGFDEVAAMLLALATITPTLTWLFCLYVFLWTFSKRRWRFTIWFLSSMFILLALSFIYLPDWWVQALREAYLFFQNGKLQFPAPLITQMPGIWEQRLSWILTIALGLVLLVEWRASMRSDDFLWFIWTCCLTLVAANWLGLRINPVNYLILFLPLILILALFEERLGQKGRLVSVGIMVIILAVFWGMTFFSVKGDYQKLLVIPVNIPFPLVILAALYWIRWWVIHPRQYASLSERY